MSMNERERVALSIAQRDGRVTRRALVQAAGLSARTTGRVLSRLVEAGALAQDEGRGSAVGYVLVER